MRHDRNPNPSARRRPRARVLLAAALLPLTWVLLGCAGGLEDIDRETARLLAATTSRMDGNAVPRPPRPTPPPPGLADPYDEHPETVNPPASALTFVPMEEDEEAYDPAAEASAVLRRLDAEEEPEDALRLNLPAALALAMRSGREYRIEEEAYVLSALDLLTERHLWGPRFFDTISAVATASGDEGQFDSALAIVNEFEVTQRLPYGGEVSARLLATATEDLHRRVAGEEVQSAEFILEANVPLLRGAGVAAREPRLRAERELIYAARNFERFRREYLVDITDDFLNLVVALQSIENVEDELQRRLENLEREESLAEAGRTSPFNAALAANEVLDTRDQLRAEMDQFQLAVDRFKVRLGLPVDREVVIVPSGFGLPVPEITVEEAVEAALAFRLDLQTQRDTVGDARRAVAIARNDLLPDFDVFASLSVPTEDEERRAGLDFVPGDAEASAGVTVGLPLDREVERLALREAQISLERTVRDYVEFRDNVVVEVRQALRDIEGAVFSLRLQEENLEIARLRVESIEAAPDRATALERSEAADALTRAATAVDRALADVQVATLEYLLATGMLRVTPDGMLHPLEGMVLETEADVEPLVPEEAAPPAVPPPALPPAEVPPPAAGTDE